MLLEAKGLSDDRRMAAESQPEGMHQKHRPLGPGVEIVRREQTSEHRFHAQRLEEVPADRSRGESHELVRLRDHIHEVWLPICDGPEGAGSLKPRSGVRVQRSERPTVGRQILVRHDEPVRIRVRQRTKQDAVRDAEDRCREADTDGDHRDSGGCEAAVSAQAATRVADIQCEEIDRVAEVVRR